MTEREEILYWIVNLAEKHKELRLCQLLCIAADKGGWKESDLFYCDDETLYYGLQKLRKELKE